MKEQIKDYGRKSEFSGFLPGIAGIKGIPIWCYYVNRGQGVCSFGVDHKDGAIMEFFPAHTAYERVKINGFRTLIRKGQTFTEPFADEEKQPVMEIEKNSLSFVETDEQNKIETSVRYFILPEEPIGALVRKVTIKNLGEAANFEIIDGMPAIICYGVGNDSMKNMLQTTKAWMQVEDLESNIPFYRVRASMDDSAQVTEVKGGNFAMAMDEAGNLMQPIVDAEAVFDYDKSLCRAVRFEKGGLAAVKEFSQITSNLMPMAMFATEKELAKGESLTIYEIIGRVDQKSLLEEFLKEQKNGAYFEAKFMRATEIVEELCKAIETKTANPRFDEYCKYTYMDNVLRGGHPMKLGNNKIFYVYSRKHGDLERDYNYFSMLPEYYSQGNGNFRDVNQNRRCDTFFHPYVGRENLHMFYSLIQLDGYNPLSIEKLTYEIDEEKAKQLLATVKEKEVILDALREGFTPGQLYRLLQEKESEALREELFVSIMDFAEVKNRASFGEGYWCDHWTYNLDLVEEYLSLFPDKEEEMLFEKAYTFFVSQANINPRRKRYAITDNGIRQYYAIDQSSMRNTEDKRLRSDFGRGSIIYSDLMEKLILLSTIKFATLDAYGMGIEMEGGKPGWYDALNGAPGMLGSSMAETYELARMLEYTIGAIKRYPKAQTLLEETANLLKEIALINEMEMASVEAEGERLAFWNKINDAKEAYRNRTYDGISGKTVEVSAQEILLALEGFQKTVAVGIKKAVGYGKGICPTYFTYQVTEYEENEDGIFPLHFQVQTVPYFLEGPVRFLKLQNDGSVLSKECLYQNVKASDVFDQKLHMYKVNASLEDASYELGRTRAFTPGWLENESVFLHMEYKYLLEILKSGLYQEFFDDFSHMAIPFLDPKMYGRSTLENSSFLAGSKNPNERIHGKGFVARLSGSTVEFISMWKRMMFGEKPFRMEDGALCAKLEPAMPKYLIGEDGTVEGTFLGDVKVTYSFASQKDYIPGEYEILETKLEYKDGRTVEFSGGCMAKQEAKDLRDGKIGKIFQKIK